MEKYLWKTGILSMVVVFVLSVTPCLALVNGTIIDSNDIPVTGAIVTFINESNNDLSNSAITDNNGFYTIYINKILPPYDVIISDVPNDHGYQLQISWSPSPSDVVITHYNIYRSRNQTLTEPLIISSFSSIDELVETEENTTILIEEVSSDETEFIDLYVPLNGETYYYWVEAVSESGSSEKVPAGYVTSVNNRNTNPQPFTLKQNYPNPFNPSTTIPFSLNKSGFVNLSIYNIVGQKVSTLVNNYQSVGSHTVTWNGLDDSGKSVGAGIYIYQLRFGDSAESRKMLLIDGGSSSSFSGSNQIVTKANVMAKSVSDAESSTYLVTITGDDIEPYEESGVTIVDGETYDFVVVRKPFKIHDITFVSIPGGTFQMGDGVGNLLDMCRPVHTVTVSDFDMSMTEITNARYAAYLNDALSSGDINEPSSGFVTGKIGDYSGQIYIRLSGSLSSYPQNECWIRYKDNTFVVESGYEKWPVAYMTWYGAKAFALYYGLDLPTEAEWEYAARGGKQYAFGTDDGTLSPSKVNYSE